MRILCQHCGADLGELLPEEPAPHCVDHPDGATMIAPNEEPSANDDPQPG